MLLQKIVDLSLAGAGMVEQLFEQQCLIAYSIIVAPDRYEPMKSTLVLASVIKLAFL